MLIDPATYVIINVTASGGAQGRFLIRRTSPPSLIARECEETLTLKPTPFSSFWELLHMNGDQCKNFERMPDGWHLVVRLKPKVEA